MTFVASVNSGVSSRSDASFGFAAGWSGQSGRHDSSHRNAGRGSGSQFGDRDKEKVAVPVPQAVSDRLLRRMAGVETVASVSKDCGPNVGASPPIGEAMNATVARLFPQFESVANLTGQLTLLNSSLTQLQFPSSDASATALTEDMLRESARVVSVWFNILTSVNGAASTPGSFDALKVFVEESLTGSGATSLSTLSSKVRGEMLAKVSTVTAQLQQQHPAETSNIAMVDSRMKKEINDAYDKFDQAISRISASIQSSVSAFVRATELELSNRRSIETNKDVERYKGLVDTFNVAANGTVSLDAAKLEVKDILANAPALEAAFSVLDALFKDLPDGFTGVYAAACREQKISSDACVVAQRAYCELDEGNSSQDTVASQWGTAGNAFIGVGAFSTLVMFIAFCYFLKDSCSDPKSIRELIADQDNASPYVEPQTHYGRNLGEIILRYVVGRKWSQDFQSWVEKLAWLCAPEGV